MKAPYRSTLGVFVVMIASAALAAPETRPAASPQDAAEPPAELSLDVNGRATPILLDVPVTVQVDGKPMTLRLSVKPDRQFDKSGVRFRYPRNFAFAFDRNPSGVDTWTLRGPSASVFLMRFPGKLDPADLLKQMTDSMAKRFPPEGVKQSETSITLQGRTLKGTRIEARLPNQMVQQDFFVFDGPERSFILMLQDQRRPDSEATEEFGGVVELMGKTFEFPEQKK